MFGRCDREGLRAKENRLRGRLPVQPVGDFWSGGRVAAPAGFLPLDAELPAGSGHGRER